MPRRRGKDRDAGLLDIGQASPHVLGNARTAEAVSGALFKGFERGKDGASIGTIGTCRGRKTGKAYRIAHPRHLQHNVCDLPDHGVGTLQGRSVWQLHVDNQIALILGRDEAGRHGGEFPIRQAQQTDIDHQRQHAEAQHRVHQVTGHPAGLYVGVCGDSRQLEQRQHERREQLIGEKATEQRNPEARQGLPLSGVFCGVGSNQLDGPRWRHGQGIQG